MEKDSDKNVLICFNKLSLALFKNLQTFFEELSKIIRDHFSSENKNALIND